MLIGTHLCKTKPRKNQRKRQPPDKKSMPTYLVNAINIGSFNLGESDKIITLFSAERGLIRAVAKGARKPGSKIAGRAELLTVNRLLLANGRSLDIITQAESIETFKSLRNDLTRLSYALYYAELSYHLGQGVNQESAVYFETLINALRQLSDPQSDPAYLCLTFQLSLLHLLGLKPELDSCVVCHKRLLEYDLSVFDHDLGGAVCDQCFSNNAPNRQAGRQKLRVAESPPANTAQIDRTTTEQVSPYFTYLTPLVWKKLILADNASAANKMATPAQTGQSDIMEKTIVAARHLLETYIEHRAGRKMNSLALI
jgi:DNA repair protein RecO (recombination protein O)